MTIQQYFGDWHKVVDLPMVNTLMHRLLHSGQVICPLPRNVFKAFTLCPLSELKVVIIGQDPYPNLHDGIPVATGMAFANSEATPPPSYSPSLKVLMESVIDYTIPHGNITFDPSLEKWGRQGVLMLNSALSCVAGQPGSHGLMWRPFMESFLTRLSCHTSGIVYVLLGERAKSLRPYINPMFNFIADDYHPAWYARNHTPMPSSLWININKLVKSLYGSPIAWYDDVS